jgi:hypothetical protein
MFSIRRPVFALALALLAALAFAPLASAAGGQGKVRVFHNSPDTPAVDIWVDGTKILPNVPYGTLSDYLELDAGRYAVEVKVSPSSEDDAAALSANLRVGRSPLTVAAIGSLAGDGESLRLSVLRDEGWAWGRWSKLRVAHTSPDAPAVDVQLRLGDWWLPVIRNLRFGRTAGYLPLPAVVPWSGDEIAYDFRVVVAGTDTSVLDLPGTVLPAGRALTVWAVGFVSPAAGNSNAFGPFISLDGRN